MVTTFTGVRVLIPKQYPTYIIYQTTQPLCPRVWTVTTSLWWVVLCTTSKHSVVEWRNLRQRGDNYMRRSSVSSITLSVMLPSLKVSHYVSVMLPHKTLIPQGSLKNISANFAIFTPVLLRDLLIFLMPTFTRSCLPLIWPGRFCLARPFLLQCMFVCM